MVKKIQQKIVGMAVVQNNKSQQSDLGQMHDKAQRSAALQNFTYKISTPVSEHALYVTISDIILNQGTQHELRRPFEICINSKNMDELQWIVVLFRIISAVFRRGGDVTFLVEELRGAFDASGDDRKTDGRYVPSLVAEIGNILETHLKQIGILEDEVNEHARHYRTEKRRDTLQVSTDSEDTDSEFPLSAELCPKCLAKAVVYLDGCLTCLSCGDSKCG